MSRVIAISNQKGGVGKTTTTFNLGAALAERGQRVLIIDLDQQGSLSISAGLDPDTLEEDTIYHILSPYTDPKIKHPPLLESIIRPLRDNLAFIPANIEFAAIDLELMRAYSRETVLKRALVPVRDRYNFILLDSPPSLGLVVINALTAADEVIIPLQADYLATKGVTRLLDTIDAITVQLNPDLKITGIVLTQADQRTSHSREIIELAKTTFADSIHVFESLIKTSVRIKEAPIQGQSILEYDSGGDAAAAYRRLAEEVLNG